MLSVACKWASKKEGRNLMFQLFLKVRDKSIMFRAECICRRLTDSTILFSNSRTKSNLSS